jgi:hypothetical protein
MKQAITIDEVISILENIIQDTKKNNNTLGYFAVLYQKVTIKVREGIESGFFDDGPRMERLDVIFANRYLEAYFDYENREPITESWEMTFNYSTKYWPIVLQHLLMGMNAHINLDLGIAAAAVMKNQNINDLEGDFNRINEVLYSLVNEIQQDLAEIWPPLKWLLKLSGKIDDHITDFNMKLARDGAWKFAKSIAGKPKGELELMILARDKKVAVKSRIITNPGFLVSTLFILVRIGERGNVGKKIRKLK